jgi:hypothetical protein|tara:strand:- start:1007 stop:1273 length:267 start_codon:yes stop_codon:yes gene_type:complete
MLSFICDFNIISESLSEMKKTVLLMMTAFPFGIYLGDGSCFVKCCFTTFKKLTEVPFDVAATYKTFKSCTTTTCSSKSAKKIKADPIA